MMSVPDYATGGAIVAKQRNSKRRRHHCSSSSPAAASSSSSHSSSSSTQKEEEDEREAMAKCLILLAQGQGPAVEPERVVMPAPAPSGGRPKSTTSRRLVGGVCVSYECKTCNKCFPSFQALGGHRTSHNNDNNKKQQQQQLPRQRPEEAPAPAVTTRPPAHECSSCGAVFASGQALGSHMRRHRPLTTSSSSAAAPDSVVTANINLELDLNLLPAPSTEQEVTSPAKPPLQLMHALTRH